MCLPCTFIGPRVWDCRRVTRYSFLPGDDALRLLTCIRCQVVVAKYVMVDKNLPDDRRDLDLLMSIMRQCPYYTQWTQSVWKCPVLMQGLRRLSRVTTPTT